MLSAAVAEYIADRTREHERSVLSLAQLGTTTCAMNALQSHFLDQPVSQFTGEQLLPFIERGRPTLKTYNNRRSLVSNFFRYAVQHGWAAENPVEKTPYYRVTHLRGSAKTISAERAAALMSYLETYEDGTLVPYFSICLFAGVRPCFKTGEISKLQPESVMLNTGAIHIEPLVSKVRMKRVVTIQPNLAAWLSAYQGHNNGSCRHTSKYRPWILITYLGFSDKYRALDFERYLKNSSGKAFAKKRLWNAVRRSCVRLLDD